MTHNFLLIQAVYEDCDLSRRRLQMAAVTSGASLMHQSVKPVIKLTLHPEDRYGNDRIQLYQSTGCEVIPIYRDRWVLYGDDWELPPGRKLVSRLDDDDVVCSDFFRRTLKVSRFCHESAIIWPTGYIFENGKIYQLTNHRNQFLSIVTEGDFDPHRQPHFTIQESWCNVIASKLPSWIWIRHDDATVELPIRYRAHQVLGIVKGRFQINLRAIHRLDLRNKNAQGRI